MEKRREIPAGEFDNVPSQAGSQYVARLRHALPGTTAESPRDFATTLNGVAVNTSHFAAVTVGKHGELHWTDELELCADALYLQISGKSVDDLFPSLRVSADG